MVRVELHLEIPLVVTRRLYRKGDNAVYIWHYTALTKSESEVEFEITAPEQVGAFNRLVLEVEPSDKMSLGYIPLTFRG